jgi:microtubule-associated protein-like 1/2
MSVDRSSTNEVLAVGLSNGEVRLYQYPVLPKQEDYHSVQLHAGPVSHCCFNCDGTHLITNGTMDGTIAIWKVVMEES